MQTEIKCELMDEWDFDHCISCKRFRLRLGKGLKTWGCVLNNDNANERREFSLIWAYHYLGLELTIPKVKNVRPKRKKKGDKK